MKEEKDKSRTRNYATIVYEDSAPKNWMSILEDTKIPAFISPYHNADINPDGKEKKPHYHVIIMFDSVKTVDQAKEILKLINGVGCEKVNSIRGYARYLCHLDNPEKTKYEKEKVVCLNGADYFSVISLPTDRYGAIKEMIQFCKDNNVVSYSDLLEYAMDNNQDWFASLCDNSTLVIKEYLKSKTWYKGTSKKTTIVVDRETGEIVKDNTQ